MNETYPISKHSQETGWIFIQDFSGTQDECYSAMKKMQESDPSFRYCIWDDRD